VSAALPLPPATKALDPDLLPRLSLRHAVYATLLHFGLESAKPNRNLFLIIGAAVWVTGTYDPATNQTLWGTGNPVPMFDPFYRPGDNRRPTRDAQTATRTWTIISDEITAPNGTKLQPIERLAGLARLDAGAARDHAGDRATDNGPGAAAGPPGTSPASSGSRSASPPRPA
jgi:hypothetical protein